MNVFIRLKTIYCETAISNRGKFHIIILRLSTTIAASSVQLTAKVTISQKITSCYTNRMRKSRNYGPKIYKKGNSTVSSLILHHEDDEVQTTIQKTISTRVLNTRQNFSMQLMFRREICDEEMFHHFHGFSLRK